MTGPESAPARIPRTIRNRLALSIGVLVVSTVALTAGGFAGLANVVSEISDETGRTNQLVEAHEAIHVSLITQQAQVLRYAAQPSRDARDAFVAATVVESDAYLTIARFGADDAALEAAAADVRRAANEWRRSWADPILDLEDARPSTESQALQPVLASIDALRGITIGLHDAATSALVDMVDNQQALIVPLVAAVTLLIVAAGYWLMRSISGPLHRLNRTAEALTAGEQVTFVPERDDEIGALAAVLERMRAEAESRYGAARSEAATAATFNQLAELTSFAQDEATLVDAATRVLQRIASSPRGQVMLLNNSTNRLSVAATWGDGLPDVGSVVGIDRPDRCPGIRRATAYVTDDGSDELAVRCPAHRTEGSGSVVCLPMPALGSIVGVIHLERPAAHSFDTVTVQRAARVAEQVALALANARLMKTMEGLANTDPLTGLRNARFIDAYLEQEFLVADRDGTSIGLLMLDVDHFKKFNDTYGHPAGDEALRALSRTMRGTLRASDIIARYGGEEFLIALHHAGLAESRVIAEKLRSAVEQMVVEIGPGRYGRISVSVGVAATDAHRVDRKGLISLADAALYRAKDAGRNRIESAPTGAATPRALAPDETVADEPTILPVKRAPARGRRG